MTDGWHDTPTPRELRGLPRTTYARSHAMPWEEPMSTTETRPCPLCQRTDCDHCRDWPQFGSVAEALDGLAAMQARDHAGTVYTCRCCGRYHMRVAGSA